MIALNFKEKLRPFFRSIKLMLKVNFVKTFYINFKTQSLINAWKFPIIVYGDLRIYSLKGNIVIDAPISMGMIQIGKDVDQHPVSLCPIKISVYGTLRFKGHAIIGGGSTVTVWSGEIEIGKYVVIASGVQLRSILKITIGEFSRITALSVVMDTNVHYIKNIQTGKINKASAPIKIGKNCWLNSGTVVLKGAVIPDYCVSARNTYLNKDYSKTCDEHTFFSGSPAKASINNIQRIFNSDEEQRLNQFFAENTDCNEYIADALIYQESSKIESIFKLI
jgi:acetyltransferase-like isoleucine patch superfamily enzyme